MVKSKKMSKTSIAVIILALLLVLSMVLGLTGAWFTSSKDTNVSTNSLSFGKVGVITLSAEGVKHERYDSTQSKFVEVVSGPVLPGDRVTAGALSFAYDSAQAGTETEVYYIVFDGAHYYKIDNTNHLLVELGENEGAPKVDKNGTLTVSGQNLRINLGTKDDPDWYCLDGSYDNTETSGNDGSTAAKAKESWQIASVEGATPQGLTLENVSSEMAIGQSGEVVYQEGGFTYHVAVIQSTNVSDSIARTVLAGIVNPSAGD